MVIEEFLEHYLKKLGLQQSGKRKLLRAQRKLLRQKGGTYTIQPQVNRSQMILGTRCFPPSSQIAPCSQCLKEPPTVPKTMTVSWHLNSLSS